MSRLLVELRLQTVLVNQSWWRSRKLYHLQVKWLHLLLEGLLRSQTPPHNHLIFSIDKVKKMPYLGGLWKWFQARGGLKWGQYYWWLMVRGGSIPFHSRAVCLKWKTNRTGQTCNKSCWLVSHSNMLLIMLVFESIYVALSNLRWLLLNISRLLFLNDNIVWKTMTFETDFHVCPRAEILKTYNPPGISFPTAI